MLALLTVLRINATFSLLSGILLVLFTSATADLFGATVQWPFQVLGYGLLFFALSVFYESVKQRPLFVLSIIVQDVLWVIGSVIIIAMQAFDLSFAGYLIIAIVAIMVLFFAIGQSLGLMRVDEKSPGSPRKLLTFERTVTGSTDLVWEVISDIGNYHEVAPNIDAVRIVSGVGEGLIRSCSQGDASWTESCILWEPGTQFSFLVDTQAPDYPFPLNYLQGTWQVEEQTATQSTIRMIFEFEYKKPMSKLLMHPLLQKRFGAICEKLLDNWEALIQQKRDVVSAAVI